MDIWSPEVFEVGHYKNELVKTNQQLTKAENLLREYLFTNRSKITTQVSDNSILQIVETIKILSYNQAIYERKVVELEKGKSC